jgi:nucleotide-binding universal stress UspA family protein
MQSPGSLFRVLVATDLSECSINAVRTALMVAERTASAEVVLLHVMDASEQDTKVAAMEETERMSTLLLNEISKMRNGVAIPSHVRLHCHVVRGVAAQAIVSEAQAHHSDLVVVGTHGRRGFERLVLGSVAETVVRLSPCSVLTVKQKST